MDNILTKLMQKAIPYLGVTLLLVVLIFLARLLILAQSHERLNNITTEVLSEQTIYFNTDERIKYRHLSKELKKYVSKEDFNSIETWHDAYEVFVEGVDETHSKFSDNYRLFSSKYVINTKGQVAINFVESYFGFLGVRIDYIYINPRHLGHLSDLEED
ncbi:UNVERIFIED_CONTAM: hypothetical protein Cloal_0105 [Acetivibrio alkalicellulosi]